MNWYKKSQMTFNEFGEAKFKWPKGWKCSVKKENNKYWAYLRFEDNLVQYFPGDYPSQARLEAFKWLQWYLKGGKELL